MANNNADILLTGQEVCERLRIKMSTLRNMVKRNNIAVIKMGPKVWRYRSGDVEALLFKDVTPDAQGGGKNSRVPTQLQNRFAEMRREHNEKIAKLEAELAEMKSTAFRFEDYLEQDRRFINQHI
jgi:excisionase family DNA binding protein